MFTMFSVVSVMLMPFSQCGIPIPCRGQWPKNRLSACSSPGLLSIATRATVDPQRSIKCFPSEVTQTTSVVNRHVFEAIILCDGSTVVSCCQPLASSVHAIIPVCCPSRYERRSTRSDLLLLPEIGNTTVTLVATFLL